MRTISCLLLYLASLSFIWAQEGAAELAEASARFEVLVQLKANQQPKDLLQAFQQNFQSPLRLKRAVVASRNIYLFQYPTTLEASQVLPWMKKQKSVAFVQKNAKVEYRNTIPNDPLYGNQWNMDIIKAPAVWDRSTGGKTANGDDIVVAVIDSGCQLAHDDLQANLWKNKAETPGDGIDNDNNGYIDDYQGWNTDNLTDEHPESFHGTAVAGIVGAKGDNNLGVTGVNWDVKLLNISGANFSDEIVEMYYYIADLRRAYNQSNGQKGAFVVATNSSFGLTGDPADYPLWCNAYDTLGLVGVLNAGATTNADLNVDEIGDMPSSCQSDFLITVTDTDQNDERQFSGYGKKNVDLGAPGSPSYTVNQNNGYANFGGTSAATPHVAGAIALLYSMPCDELATNALLNPAGTALKIKRHILNGTDLLASLKDKTSTGGRLNLEKAAAGLMNSCNGVGALKFLNTFPNPTNGLINLSFQRPDNTAYTITVYNSLGQLMDLAIIPANSNQSELTINTAGWGQGIYFVMLENINDRISTKFMVY